MILTLHVFTNLFFPANTSCIDLTEDDSQPGSSVSYNDISDSDSDAGVIDLTSPTGVNDASIVVKFNPLILTHCFRSTQNNQ